MTLSIIAFGAMTGLVVLFLAAIFLTERSSRTTKFRESDIPQAQDDHPFKTGN
jgi:hypothetical protein